MKRIIILLLTVSMIAAAFVGCSDKPNSNKPDSEKLPSDGFGLTSEDTNGNWLRDDVELKILKYKYGKKADPDDYIVDYFGTYNDAIVLRIWAKADETPENGYGYETVAGFEFTVISGRRMLVWYNNKLHHLQEAYESGILTVDDIEILWKRRSGEIVVYGIYNRATVQEMWGNHYFDIKNDQTIAGFEFKFSIGMNIKVSCNDKLYGLKEAYEFGILTIDDIEAIHAKYLKKNY